MIDMFRRKEKNLSLTIFIVVIYFVVIYLVPLLINTYFHKSYGSFVTLAIYLNILIPLFILSGNIFLYKYFRFPLLIPIFIGSMQILLIDIYNSSIIGLIYINVLLGFLGQIIGYVRIKYSK